MGWFKNLPPPSRQPNKTYEVLVNVKARLQGDLKIFKGEDNETFYVKAFDSKDAVKRLIDKAGSLDGTFIVRVREIDIM